MEWTVETYAAHNEALREAKKEFDAERDRRYAEVLAANQKAQKLADSLYRKTRKYKDEQMNEWREQLSVERYDLAKKSELNAVDAKLERGLESLKDSFAITMKPVLEFIAAKGGVEKGTDKTFYYIITIIVTLSSVTSVLVTIFR